MTDNNVARDKAEDLYKYVYMYVRVYMSLQWHE